MSGCPCVVEITESTTEFVRGDTAYWGMCFTRDGEPVDVTGWDIYLLIRDTLDPEDALFSRKVRNTIAASDSATAGFATITIPSNESAQFPAGKYYYEFKRVLPTINPPDVWTFDCSTKPELTVKQGTPLFP